MTEQTTIINNAIWQIIVGVWILYVVSTLFYFYFKHTRVKKLMSEIDEIKDVQQEMFKNIVETFEFIASDRNNILKEIDELKRRVRMYSNESKRQKIKKAPTQNKRIV